MKLYYSPGACSMAPHIALAMSGLGYTIEKVDVANKTTESGRDFLEVSPNGYVPALELAEGDVITEAPAILQYIEALASRGQFEAIDEPRERAKLHQFLNFAASEFHKSYKPFFSGRELTDTEKNETLENIGRKFGYLESVFADGRRFLLGNKFSVADTYTYVVGSWAGLVGLDTEKWPHVSAYIERVQGLPEVQSAMRAEGLLDG